MKSQLPSVSSEESETGDEQAPVSISDVAKKLEADGLIPCKNANGVLIHTTTHIMAKCPEGHCHSYAISAVLDPTKIKCITCSCGGQCEQSLRKFAEVYYGKPFVKCDTLHAADSIAEFESLSANVRVCRKKYSNIWEIVQDGPIKVINVGMKANGSTWQLRYIFSQPVGKSSFIANRPRVRVAYSDVAAGDFLRRVGLGSIGATGGSDNGVVAFNSPLFVDTMPLYETLQGKPIFDD
jgi:hypothetical protein